MKFFFVLLAMLLVFSVTGFAQENPVVNNKIKESMKKEFVGAESVKWNDMGEYQMATFIFSGNLVQAFFNMNGDLEGYARNILFEQLPLPVIKSFEKNFPGASFSDILEIFNTDGSFYRLNVETQNKRYRVKTNADGKILQVIKVKMENQKPG